MDRNIMTKLEELQKEYHDVFYELHGYWDSQQFSPTWPEWRLEHHIFHMKIDIQERKWYGDLQNPHPINKYEGLRVW
jgi:hypothetical protein